MKISNHSNCAITTIFYDIHENPIELIFFTNSVINVLMRHEQF